jgi:hypothetical protein
LAISAPAAIIDPNTRATLSDQAGSLGASAADVIRLPATTVTQ